MAAPHGEPVRMFKKYPRLLNLLIVRGHGFTSSAAPPGDVGRDEGWAAHRALCDPVGIAGLGQGIGGRGEQAAEIVCRGEIELPIFAPGDHVDGVAWGHHPRRTRHPHSLHRAHEILHQRIRIHGVLARPTHGQEPVPFLPGSTLPI